MEAKDILHYYLGCEVVEVGGNTGTLKGLMEQDGKIRVLIDASSGMDYWTSAENIKPILKFLSSMTEEEASHFAWLCMDSRHHLDEDSRIDEDEIDINLASNDGGNMLDANIEIYIEVSCRCFEGAIVIHKDGSIYTLDESGENRNSIDDTAFKIHYLLSRGFDLFGLLNSGAAVEKVNQKV